MVEGYTGRPGAGKTLTAVIRAWAAKQAGRPIYANIPLIDWRVKTARSFFFGATHTSPMDEVTFGKSWADGPVLQTIEEVVHLDNALCILDEVHMWMPADAWKEVGFEVRVMLAQQRKDGLDIWWTAQNNARVFNVVRELTATQWRCARYGPFIVMDSLDPESKENYGKRYVLVKPCHYNLYNTRYKVGDGKSTGGSLGATKRYGDELPGAVTVAAPKVPPVVALLDREESLGGLVRYRIGDTWDWWKRKERGEDVGPSPLALRQAGANQ